MKMNGNVKKGYEKAKKNVESFAKKAKAKKK